MHIIKIFIIYNLLYILNISNVYYSFYKIYFIFLKNMKQRLFDVSIIDLLVVSQHLSAVSRLSFWDNIAQHPQKSCKVKICLDKLDLMASFWSAHKIWRWKIKSVEFELFFISVLQNIKFFLNILYWYIKYMLNSEFFINSIFFQYSLMIVNIIKIKNYNFSFFNFFFVKKIKLFSLRNANWINLYILCI